VAKELGFEEGLRNSSAVDRDERLAAARRETIRTGVFLCATRRIRRLTSSMQSAFPISSGKRSVNLEG
jgi:hypothetical protein